MTKVYSPLKRLEISAEETYRRTEKIMVKSLASARY